MKKTTFMLLVMVVSAFLLSSQLGREGFMDDDGGNGNGDNWNYSSNIDDYNFGTDIWHTEFVGANGRIRGAHSGNEYIAGRDLDNPYSEVELNNESPEHIIEFDTYNLFGVDAEISSWYNYVNLDKNDYIRFEVAFNSIEGSWTASDIAYSENVFGTTQNGNYSSNDWEEFTFSVPSGNDFVRARLVVYQNGNEYLGFDSFQLNPSTLSSKNNIIEGFSFNPNPTSNFVHLKARTILDKVDVYNILSKKVLTQNGSSMQMDLNLSNLTPGIYFARIASNGLEQTVKLVKK